MKVKISALASAKLAGCVAMTPLTKATFRSHRLAVRFYIMARRLPASEKSASGSLCGVLFQFGSMNFSSRSRKRKREREKKN
ncbi:hypothetical protein BDV36DRAFT_267511 [Aspergillus pseudocaelatus]|uniref:Secreted protein n=1 Tax=Aspergillus pseudocaelatus TaxID=1825620 RepID=A0ABQ6W9F6_9EURO|nr:hypothetical protein BDV36DRAFT_267511 [Aspergillus pseudocaelatus]